MPHPDTHRDGAHFFKKNLQRFAHFFQVADVLSKVFHEGRPASADCSRVRGAFLRLRFNVCRSKTDVRLKKLYHEPECFFHELFPAVCTAFLYASQDGKTGYLCLFKQLNEPAVTGWHVSAHSLEIGKIHIFIEPHTQERIENRKDGTLRAGFPVKLLRCVTEASFIHDAVWQRRIRLPSVDIRTQTVKIDVRVAPFGHPSHRDNHLFKRANNDFKAKREMKIILCRNRPQYLKRGGSDWPCARLYVHMNEHKPILVQSAVEILDNPDVAECYWPFSAEATPILKRV